MYERRWPRRCVSEGVRVQHAAVAPHISPIQARGATRGTCGRRATQWRASGCAATSVSRHAADGAERRRRTCALPPLASADAAAGAGAASSAAGSEPLISSSRARRRSSAVRRLGAAAAAAMGDRILSCACGDDVATEAS
jgi:hypothetical protein